MTSSLGIKTTSLIPYSFKKKQFEKLVNSSNEELVDDRVYDLLIKMLKIDHIERITATEALLHPYFDPIR
jgi:casein kinase II subunit alpha